MASVTVNPVVLLNIADSVQRGLSKFGVLRGHVAHSASSLSAQVLNSFELSGDSLDMDYISERDELMTQIYPEEGGIVGVYVVDDHLTLSPTAQTLAQQLQLPIVLMFSPKKSINKDGQYYRVFDVNRGRELKKDVSHVGEEAINSVLVLKEPNSTEMTKSKDLVDTNRDVLNIIQERTLQLINFLEDGKVTEFETLRELNSLMSKLQYKVDDNVKQSLVDAENTYKLVQTTAVVHANTQSIEQAATDVGSRTRSDQNII